MWINKNKWLNELWCGDNIEVLKNLPGETVDLIYIDPPFFSNKHYEVIWGNGAELRSFGDRWKGGIEHYVGWMVDRLKEFHRILKPNGSIYVHLDWHASHYIKVEMDKIFGYENFRNEIAWCYRKWATKSHQFARNHDVILFYSKEKNNTFNVQYAPSSPGTLKRWKGKKQQAILKNGKRTAGSLENASKGSPMSDWWEISIINPASKERIGYPTQKPEELLERIIKASSNEGDVILDAFSGCGTTISVAEKLNRKWIGIDVSPVAVKVMTERLKIMEEKMGKNLEDFITLGIPEKTIAYITKMSGVEFQDFIIEQINGKASLSKVHDFGIDGFTKDGIPIQVKRSEKIGRNVIDNFQTAIHRIKSKKGKIYALSFGRGAVEEVARVKREDGIDIELVDLKTLVVEKYGDHSHQE